MTLDETIKEMENNYWYLVHNRCDPKIIATHFYEYSRHLKQYEILERPLPDNNYNNILEDFYLKRVERNVTPLKDYQEPKKKGGSQ